MSSQCSLPTITTWVCWLAAVCLDRAGVQFSPVWLNSLNHRGCVWTVQPCTGCWCMFISLFLFCICMHEHFQQDVLSFCCNAAKTFGELNCSATVQGLSHITETGNRKINLLHLNACLSGMWCEARIPNPRHLFFFCSCEIQLETSEKSPRYGSREQVVSFLDRSFSGLLFSARIPLFPAQTIAQQEHKKGKKTCKLEHLQAHNCPVHETSACTSCLSSS